MIRYTDNASFQRRLGHAGNTRSSVSLIYRGLSFLFIGAFMIPKRPKLC